MEEDGDEWYFTLGADQVGPVSFEELKAKAAAGELHPRNDMAWKPGMDEWVAAGQIENLFEKRAMDGADAMGASMTAMEASKPAAAEETVLWPGASRRWYILLVLLFPILWAVIALTVATFMGSSLSPGFQKLFLLLGLLVPVWVVIDVSLSRLTNLGMNKLWFFIYCVPVVNLWLAYRSVACPAGYAKGTKMDPIGWLLGGVYWLCVIGWVAAAILLPAMISTALRDSGWTGKMELLREQMEQSAEGEEQLPSKPGESKKPEPAP